MRMLFYLCVHITAHKIKTGKQRINIRNIQINPSEDLTQFRLEDYEPDD